MDSPQSGDVGESIHSASSLLRKFSAQISCAIVSPDVLAEKLYIKKFISHSVYQAAISQSRPGKDRCEELLEEVRYGIRHKSLSFEDFLKTLQELPQLGTLPNVITSLQADHGKINWSACINLVKHLFD